MLSGTVYSFSIGFMRFNLMVAVVVEVSSFGVGIELVLVNWEKVLIVSSGITVSVAKMDEVRENTTSMLDRAMQGS